MKQFLEKKEKGFWCSAAAIVLFAVGLVFYRMLTAVSFETTERPVLVILFAFAAILFSLIASYKDYGKLPSILAYADATVTFFTLLEGRASYLAFYFTGDVMHTGLSPYMIGSFVCFLLGMLAALFAVIFEEDKGGRPCFAAADMKVIIPMLCVVAILALVVCLNADGTRGESGTVNSSTEIKQTAQNEAAPAGSAQSQAEAVPEARYKKPNTSEEVWQEYSAADYLNEEISGKAIAYQLIGHGEVDAGGPVPADALLNMYENGGILLTVYTRGNAYQYYGYWTNEDDDHLWFCVKYYKMYGNNTTCTIDYGYELTGSFDEITVNIALGLADGGQFVRSIPVGGDGTVQYATPEEWLTTLGWVAPDPEELAAMMAENGYGNSGTAETDEPADVSSESTGAELLFPFTADADSFKLGLYTDGTYVFQFTSMNIVEPGTWTWKDWTLTLTTEKGKTAVASIDSDTHALNIHFVPDLSDQLERDYTAESGVWGVAFNGQGDYTPVASEPQPAKSAEPELLFPFTADADSFKLDLYTDGTYVFQFTSMNIVEPGTWTWKDWTLTLTTEKGKTAVASIDSETHALNIHFVPDLSDQLERDYTAESGVWGVAFNGQGSYTLAVPAI